MNVNDLNKQKLYQLVDRLVCGELDEDQRFELLTYLEHKPEYWRQVGIAFMEAQSWTEAIVPERPESRLKIHEAQIISPSFDPKSRTNRGRWNWLPLMAAICLISFTFGWLFKQVSEGDGNSESIIAKDLTSSPVAKSDEMVWATIDSRVMLIPIQGARVQVPVRIEDGKIQRSSYSPEISDYEMAQFRRHGIALKPEKKFISGTLPDGRNVAIPLDGFVATHTPQMVN
ncbi:MAG: hypothetical protein U0930_05330 [Pirellulales bacterium]